MTREAFERHYPLRLEHEVTFNEIDMLRHVNNAVYVVWAETIRCRYVADVLQTDIAGREGIILAKHELTYEAPVPYRDRVVIGARVAKIGTKSLVFETGVWSAALARRVFVAEAICVAFDYAANASIPIPRAWRDRTEAFQTIAVDG